MPAQLLDIGSGAGRCVTPASSQTAPAGVATDGKFFRAGSDRFLVKGVTYGTFAPGEGGSQFPPLERVSDDFQSMRSLGINTVRTYTAPRIDLLDEAARHGLRVIVGLPWSQHTAFLDEARQSRSIRRDLVSEIAVRSTHPAVLMFALGNEIPPGVVRWHGSRRIERFLRDLYDAAKDVAPERLFTYVNFPPTEFIEIPFFDVCAFNVYLHRESALRGYLARLQHLAGNKPLLLAEAGADSIREGMRGQAEITAMHIRAAFEEGAAGAIAFAWTDEWWRGGHHVTDWAFGLVDRARNAKPAAAAVAAAYATAPFSDAERRGWPPVSVIVCAYNAADTLDDCLQALEQMTYPDYEIIVVNDGSHDGTGDVAHRHPRVRVIDVSNGGLSVARNIGLTHATGDIVAYTDADVRVDRDWLTYLVQPFLHSDVVAAGGPNLVPADDPPLAQCVARAPGGPTHVLLDDRIAEHVPGCNIAVRREALLAIGGFNPIFLRAGDDVDVCWRLQARGWKLGFAPSALVWHHHRASLTSYWRQQVGYGEGETWLMAQHPEKFLNKNLLWRGSIYSPLPFIRSLSTRRVNTGAWGTAAFPSVYRANAHPLTFLPHSMGWQTISALLIVASVAIGARGDSWAAAVLLLMGLCGLGLTLARNLLYSWRSDLQTVPPIVARRDRAGVSARRTAKVGFWSRLWYRTMIAMLHFVQPIARARGRLRGLWSRPAVELVASPPRTTERVRPSWRETGRALLLLAGTLIEEQFWSETWTTSAGVLDGIVRWLRRSPDVRLVEVDEGWAHDRDLSVFVGRWAWLDLRALVEDHGSGRTLLRVSRHLRPTKLGTVGAVGLGAALLIAASAGVALRWPTLGASAALLTALVVGLAAWRTAQATAAISQGLARMAGEQGMIALPARPTRLPLGSPSQLRAYGLRSGIIFVVMVAALGADAVMLREAVTSTIVTGARKGYSGDNGPAVAAWLDTPGGIAIAPTGDIYFADSQNHVIRRVDRRGVITTVAGNHDAGSGFSGDNGPALAAQFDTPDGVAIAPDGDLIVADSYNDRIRRVDLSTGAIATIAGSGANGFEGDGGPALEAALRTPTAVAVHPSGDIYVADTLNNRIRRIDHTTGSITTVAGDGLPGEAGAVGDGGPAWAAHLYMPSDVAIGPNGDLYIADMHHNRVRRVDVQTGLISTVAGDGSFGNGGNGGPATLASLAGPAAIALVPQPAGGLVIFIADYYNGLVREVGPGGTIKTVNDQRRDPLGAPARVAFGNGWLYVADAQKDQLIALTIPNLAPKPGRGAKSPLRRVG